MLQAWPPEAELRDRLVESQGLEGAARNEERRLCEEFAASTTGLVTRKPRCLEDQYVRL